MLDKIKNWLATYPGWGDTKLWVDRTHHVPNSAGLYPEGMEQVTRKVDILGNVTVTNRCRFALQWVVSAHADPQQTALWLLELQGWVQQQDMAGLAPSFGRNTHWKAEAGKKQKTTNSLTDIYTVTLCVEYEM